MAYIENNPVTGFDWPDVFPPQDNTSLPTVDKPVESYDDLASEISQMVIKSPNYQQALAVFQKESNKQWLNELEMIPYMVLDPHSGFFQDITGRYEDRLTAAYQYCMERIATLLRDYYTWKESLPSTQVNRQQQVGFNAAITGEGIGGSSVPSMQNPSTNPSSLGSVNPVDAVSNVASVLTSVSGGFLSWANLFRQVSQFGQNLQLGRDNLSLHTDTLSFQKDSFLKSLGLSLKQFEHRRVTDLVSLNKTLADSGYPVMTEGQSLEDFLSSISESVPAGNAFSAEMLKSLGYEYQVKLADEFQKSVNDNITAFAKLQYDIYKNDLELKKLSALRQKAENNYQLGYYGDDPNKFGEYMQSVDVQISELKAFRDNMEQNYIEGLMDKANNGDSPSAYMLSQYLTGISVSDRAKMTVSPEVLFWTDNMFK